MKSMQAINIFIMVNNLIYFLERIQFVFLIYSYNYIDIFVLSSNQHVFVMPSSSARCSQLPRAEDKLPFYIGLRKLRDFVNGRLHSLNEIEITFPDIKIKDTDDVLQKTIIRISNKPFSELSPETLKAFGDKIPSGQLTSKFHSENQTTQIMSILNNQQNENLFNYDQISTNKNSSSSSIKMSETDAAVLAALANGGYGTSSSSSSSPIRQTQTIYIGRQQQSVTTIKPNSISTTSHTIHHLPQTSSHDSQTSSVSLLSTNSQIIPHQIVVLNPTERSSPSTSLKDLLSSQSTSSNKHLLFQLILQN